MKRALCIGINNYPGTDSDLSGCVNDANDWARELAARGFAVKTLLDKTATRENILANLHYLIVKTAPGDSLIIQYSGHGTQFPDENGDESDRTDEALCPYDICDRGPVLDDEIWAAMKAKRAGAQLFFISDSCHSGSVVRAFDRPHLGTRKFMSPFRFLEGRKADWALQPGGDTEEKTPWPCGLMAGCQDHEYSYDAVFHGRPNGAFPYWALYELRRLAPGATYQDWFRAIGRHLPSSDYPQKPNMLGSYQGKEVLS